MRIYFFDNLRAIAFILMIIHHAYTIYLFAQKYDQNQIL